MKNSNHLLVAIVLYCFSLFLRETRSEIFDAHSDVLQVVSVQEFIEEPFPTETPGVEAGSAFVPDGSVAEVASLLQSICVKFFDDNGIVCAGTKVKTTSCGIILIVSTLTCIGPVPISMFEGALTALISTPNFDIIFDPASSLLDYDMVSGVSTLQISFKS
eukprot:TRINITY_DN40767_c0_g1_i1.p1 TRINITY_DN40767_c0_g1~~TRINITY_DN40767_c0_g1_i1.p1  ORF type:complete len:161 (+),score=27.20 TRINITY_DN40767_c0_g1_i1:949-1431(+)